MNITFKPWQVPNFCVQEMPRRKRQDGFKEAPSWHLREVDTEVLARMCDEFRAEVFRKAGKPDPLTQGASIDPVFSSRWDTKNVTGVQHKPYCHLATDENGEYINCYRPLGGCTCAEAK